MTNVERVMGTMSGLIIIAILATPNVPSAIFWAGVKALVGIN